MQLPTLVVLTCAALPACTAEGPDKTTTTTTSDDDRGFWAAGERDLHGEPHL